MAKRMKRKGMKGFDKDVGGLFSELAAAPVTFMTEGFTKKKTTRRR